MTTNQKFLINGRESSDLSPLDRGLSYGDGVFRTIKVLNGKPEQWARHYQKLLEDCNALKIVCPASDLLLNEINYLFDDSALSVAKIIVTRGVGARGYALPVVAQPTHIVFKSDFPDYPPSYFSEGVALHLCQLRLSQQPILAGVKHLNRLENVLARMEWNNPEIADGLLLDVEGRVIECTMSNVFARYGDQLLTPDLSMCGVAGITRQHILDSAASLGLITHVVTISLEKLLQADEIIICNSLYGAWQVRSLNGQTWLKQGLAEQLRSCLWN